MDQSSETEREINLYDYVHDVFDSLKPLAKNKEIHLAIEGDKNINLTTYPGAIYQVMANLFNNSIIHGFEGSASGSVTIYVSCDEQFWRIIYRDNGVGMNEAMQKSLFEPFVTSKRNQGAVAWGCI